MVHAMGYPTRLGSVVVKVMVEMEVEFMARAHTEPKEGSSRC